MERRDVARVRKQRLAVPDAVAHRVRFDALFLPTRSFCYSSFP